MYWAFLGWIVWNISHQRGSDPTETDPDAAADRLGSMLLVSTGRTGSGTPEKLDLLYRRGRLVASWTGFGDLQTGAEG